MKNEARIRREVSIAERVDGQVIAADSPVPCDCCGKLCIVRYYEMSNGARLGKECALTLELFFGGSVRTLAQARFLGANKKQLAYMGL